MVKFGQLATQLLVYVLILNCLTYNIVNLYSASAFKGTAWCEIISADPML